MTDVTKAPALIPLSRIEQELKLQYYYGGRLICCLRTKEGLEIVIVHKGDDEDFHQQYRALSAELPIKPSSRASTIAVLYSPYSRRAGHSREKTPGRLLPQCPALLPAEEARAYPSASVGSLAYASP